MPAVPLRGAVTKASPPSAALAGTAVKSQPATAEAAKREKTKRGRITRACYNGFTGCDKWHLSRIWSEKVTAASCLASFEPLVDYDLSPPDGN